jgi:hypothetical protein
MEFPDGAYHGQPWSYRLKRTADGGVKLVIGKWFPGCNIVFFIVTGVFVHGFVWFFWNAAGQSSWRLFTVGARIMVSVFLAVFWIAIVAVIAMYKFRASQSNPVFEFEPGTGVLRFPHSQFDVLVSDIDSLDIVEADCRVARGSFTARQLFVSLREGDFSRRRLAVRFLGHIPDEVRADIERLTTLPVRIHRMSADRVPAITSFSSV